MNPYDLAHQLARAMKESEEYREYERLRETAYEDETNRALLDLLPVSHAEGTLAARFGEGSGADAAAGWVRAKTGTLSGVSALVGTVMTEDGRALTFAFLSNGSEVGEARAALDRLAASLRKA